MLKTIISSVLVSLLVSILAVAGLAPVARNIPKNVGSFVETVRINFGKGFEARSSEVNGNLTLGGANSTSTAATSFTLRALDLVNYASIFVTPNTADLNYFLPASSTFPADFLPTAGDRTSILLYNATSTSGVEVGIIAGTGSLLQVASTTPGGTASTSPDTASRIDIIRKQNKDLLFLISPFR